MAQSVSPIPSITAQPISTKSMTQSPSLGFQKVWATHQCYHGALHDKLMDRRTLTLSLVGAALGLRFSDSSANAARRPPPPPPVEKKDPNLSALQAKVLASKKRKEAMKEEMAKLREKGKTVNEPSEQIF